MRKNKISTNVIRIFICTIIFLFINESNYAQDFEIKKNQLLYSNIFKTTILIDSVEITNNLFEGYLIIEIDTHIQKQGSIYYSKIFWVDSLKQLNGDLKYFYYPFLRLSIGQTINLLNKYIDKESYTFLSTWYSLNEYSDCNVFLYKSESFLRTDILQNQIIWDYASKKYVIFKCSFHTAIAKASISKFETSDSVKILIPISPLKSIMPANPVLCRKNSLTQTDYKIRLIE